MEFLFTSWIPFFDSYGTLLDYSCCDIYAYSSISLYFCLWYIQFAIPFRIRNRGDEK